MNWDDDFTQYVTIGILFTLTVPWGRRTWLDINFLLTFIKGVYAVVFPVKAISNLTVVNAGEWNPDIIHMQLAQWVGVYTLFMAVCYWLTRRSDDVTVETSLLWSYTLAMTCILVATVYYLITYDRESARVSEQILKITIIFLPLWILVSLVYCLKDSDWGGYTEAHNDRRNFNIRVDSVFMFLFGILVYTFPDWILQNTMNVAKPDDLHIYLTRESGALIVGFAILGNRATNFQRETDKQSYLLIRLITEGTGLLIMAFYLINHQKWLGNVSNREIFVQVIIGALIIANAASGCDMRSIIKNTAESIRMLPQTTRTLVKMK